MSRHSALTSRGQCRRRRRRLSSARSSRCSRLGLGPGPAAGRLDQAGGRRTTSSSVERPRPASRPASRSAGRRAAGQRGDDRQRLLAGRRSERTGLPVTAGSPQMPSRSSTSWKARPDLGAERGQGRDQRRAGRRPAPRRSRRRRPAARRSCRPAISRHSSRRHVAAPLEREVLRLAARSARGWRRPAAGRPARRAGVGVVSSSSCGEREQRVAGQDRRAARRRPSRRSAGAGAPRRRP